MDTTADSDSAQERDQSLKQCQERLLNLVRDGLFVKISNIMLILLATAAGLVLWSVQLVRSALRLREASLIFAGTLVALSAVGLVAVYLLMDGCMGYLSVDKTMSAATPPIVVQQQSVTPVEQASQS